MFRTSVGESPFICTIYVLIICCYYRFYIRLGLDYYQSSRGNLETVLKQCRVETFSQVNCATAIFGNTFQFIE